MKHHHILKNYLKAGNIKDYCCYFDETEIHLDFPNEGLSYCFEFKVGYTTHVGGSDDWGWHETYHESHITLINCEIYMDGYMIDEYDDTEMEYLLGGIYEEIFWK